MRRATAQLKILLDCIFINTAHTISSEHCPLCFLIARISAVRGDCRWTVQTPLSSSPPSSVRRAPSEVLILLLLAAPSSSHSRGSISRCVEHLRSAVIVATAGLNPMGERDELLALLIPALQVCTQRAVPSFPIFKTQRETLATPNGQTQVRGTRSVQPIFSEKVNSSTTQRAARMGVRARRLQPPALLGAAPLPPPLGPPPPDRHRAPLPYPPPISQGGGSGGGGGGGVGGGAGADGGGGAPRSRGDDAHAPSRQ